MSSTRHASGGPLRQNRFASSPELERGLIANMVAKRCSVIERAEDRELVWFLQLLSHQDGGLKRVAAELCERYAAQIGTPSMLKFGCKPGQIYSASQVKAVRAEMLKFEDDFLLKGDLSSHEHVNSLYVERGRKIYLPNIDEAIDQHKKDCARSQERPTAYAAADFKSLALNAAHADLEDHLQRVCLDPAMPLEGGPWYFPELISTVREFQADWIAAQCPDVVTTIGKQVCEALDYALARKLLVLIDGQARTGKTHAAEAWVKQHPGRARYVQVPSTNDEVGFFRAIARALGVSCGLGWKAVQLRERIEDALQSGDIMLVLDEAHYCWPTNDYRYALPGRINWIMTALVNHNVPVALVTTPQFLATQKHVEKRTNWTSEQFIGRIGHYEKLPDTLPRKDLEAVARVRLPGAPVDAIEALVIYASNSKKYLAGIKAVAERVLYLVEKAGRKKVELLDVMRAIDESVIPSDAAFASAMNATANPGRKRVVNASERSAPRRLEPAPATAFAARGTRPVMPGQRIAAPVAEEVAA